LKLSPPADPRVGTFRADRRKAYVDR
jgi:hypothetical protein